jgi:hypothetical protein
MLFCFLQRDAHLSSVAQGASILVDCSSAFSLLGDSEPQDLSLF